MDHAHQAVIAWPPEERLAQHGLRLPPAPRPKGLYAPVCTLPLGADRLVFISGQTCRVDGVAIQGRCDDLSRLDEARAAARVAMLNGLAALKLAMGSAPSAPCQVVRLRGFIRSGPDFTAHPAVLDAASEVLALAFPGQPLPSRTAVGVGSLPDRAWIEIELDAHIAGAAPTGA